MSTEYAVRRLERIPRPFSDIDRYHQQRVLCVDDENRAIVSCVGENGVTTFLINGGTARLRKRERRVALARASTLLDQLRSCLMPLKDESEAPEFETAER